MPEAEAQAALHGAARQAEALGDDAMREALEVGEFDDGALLLGQLREGHREATARPDVVVEETGEGELRLLVRDRLDGVGGVAAFEGDVGGLDPIGARAAASEVDGAAVHDRHDERPEAARRLDAVGAFPECEEGGVDGVFGGGAVTEDAVREAERATPVGAIQLRERGGVAGLEPACEC